MRAWGGLFLCGWGSAFPVLVSRPSEVEERGRGSGGRWSRGGLSDGACPASSSLGWESLPAAMGPSPGTPFRHGDTAAASAPCPSMSNDPALVVWGAEFRELRVFSLVRCVCYDATRKPTRFNWLQQVLVIWFLRLCYFYFYFFWRKDGTIVI